MTFSNRAAATNPAGVTAVAVSGERRSYIDWPAVWAGALVAAAISLVLTMFGIAVGLSVSWPWSPRAGVSETAGIIAAAWLAFTYIWSFACGGYLAGRMRPVAGDAWRSERGFRDGANGLVVWAIGVLLGTILLAHAVGGIGLNDAGAADTAAKVTDAERRAAAFAGFWSAFVLLLSGVAAWFASSWGGQHRDQATIV